MFRGEFPDSNGTNSNDNNGFGGTTDASFHSPPFLSASERPGNSTPDPHERRSLPITIPEWQRADVSHEKFIVFKVRRLKVS